MGGEAFGVPLHPMMTPGDRPPVWGMGSPAEVLGTTYAANCRRISGPAQEALDVDLRGQEVDRIPPLLDAFRAPTNPAWEVVGVPGD